MRVENDLKPHNKGTIEKILEFYKSERKCCAIQATGTGKTFLILRLLEIFNDEGKSAVIFAPNREIIKQTKKRMEKFGLNNASFYTYQKLARMTEEEISDIEADLIICDELHRTGAKTWGQKFELLVDSHPDSKVFGVTATPLRCADGRDMSEEYFDGNKACDISLAEALVREIIPVMPLYVSALYTFEEEYQKMSDKIDKAKNSNEEKIELHKELLAAKQQLEKANGVPEIIKKYITNYNGKYLVFCKDKKHLYAMKDVVVNWFRQAGYAGKIFEYPYYSDSRMVKRNLENFENNKEEGLKLLFIIDKLNEGLHLEEVHGCILLRTTVSNIIYYQQIGRAIDAGSNEQRVILDLVSNFNSLKSFNLKKELEEKVKERREGKFSDCSEEFEIKKFDVVDCVQECVDVFNRIDEQIQGKWDLYIKSLKQYKKREGNCIVPEKHWELLDDINVNLGNWVVSIRMAKNGNGSYMLTKEREDQLNELGFIWNAKKYMFEKNINDCISFYETNGKLPSQNSKNKEERKLACRISFYKSKILKYPQWKQNLLKKIPTLFDEKSNNMFDKFYDMALVYKQRYGHINIKCNDVIDGYNIGNAFNNLIQCCKNDKLSIQQINKLKDIGIDITMNRLAKTFDNKMNLVKEALDKGIIISYSNQVYNSVNLYAWYYSHKGDFSEKELEIIQRLIPINNKKKRN